MCNEKYKRKVEGNAERVRRHRSKSKESESDGRPDGIDSYDHKMPKACLLLTDPPYGIGFGKKHTKWSANRFRLRGHGHMGGGTVKRRTSDFMDYGRTSQKTNRRTIKMKQIIAIDPGASGGIAWIDAEGIVCAEPMPDGMTAQADALRSLAASMAGAIAFVEKVGGYMPGNSGPASCKFARHCGHVEAALYILGIPTVQVAPGVWQRSLGTWPAEKPKRKRAIREEMARLYPGLRVTLKTADALGILTWAMRRAKREISPNK